MKIDKDCAVTLRARITDTQGKLLDDGKHPSVYLHGGYGNTFERLEAVLQGQEAGFRTQLELSAADAYGERDDTLLQTISKKQFPPGVKLGGELRGTDAHGHAQTYIVVKIKGDQVMLDGNHPWAGKTLRFAITVDQVRAATAEEIAHGHVHGEHGHHH